MITSPRASVTAGASDVQRSERISRSGRLWEIGVWLPERTLIVKRAPPVTRAMLASALVRRRDPLLSPLFGRCSR